MSARIVFHVVNTTSKDIGRAESSLQTVRTQYDLSTQIELGSVVSDTVVESWDPRELDCRCGQAETGQTACHGNHIDLVETRS